MMAFTEGTIAAAQRDLRRCIEALEAARAGDLTMLSQNIHKALVHAQMAAEEIERAVRLEAGAEVAQ